ncbi:MAG: sugar transferase [Eubacterium sp.]|nr:sugar transferase [Eubacterium sp.]
MNKRARIQFWFEFSTDLICLASANLISFLFFRYVIYKIVDYPAAEWVRYYAALFFAFAINAGGFYSSIDIHDRNRRAEFLSVLKNGILTYLIFSAFLLFIKNPIIESRYMFISALALFIVFSTGARYFLKRYLTRQFTSSRIASIAGIITTSDIAESFVSGVKADWSTRVSGIVLLDDFCENGDFSYAKLESAENSSPVSSTATAVKTKPKSDICDIPVVSSDENFMDWIRSAPLDEIFINVNYKDAMQVQPIIEELEDMGISVHINIPSLVKMLDESKFDNIRCKTYAGYPMATFEAASTYSNKWLAVKRLLDIIFSIIGCIVSLPIIAITAIPLLKESEGPLFFKQLRVGKNGRLFNIYKLRSMYVDAEERKSELMTENKMDGFMFKMDDDPRITKVGRFIRKYSIDELPQFFNVLKGDMSIIGTRPPTVDEFEQYESRHKRRLSMRPGISGMWQVSGRSDIENFEKVVELDCKYIDEWSPMLDIKIFFKTILVILSHKGAE